MRFTFTVFTPTYNRAHTLHRVYDSLRVQTFRDFEWIVGDDGSTDNTRELIENWSKEADFPIRYFYQENMGKHVAVNRGVQMACGELFLIADSDDALEPLALETYYRYWMDIPKESRSEFSGIWALCQDTQGRIVGDCFPSSPFDSTPSEVFYRFRCRGEKAPCVRTDVMKEFPFPEDKIKTYIPENLVWRRIAKKYKTRFINEALRIYYTDQPGYMRAFGGKRVRYSYGGRQEHLMYLNEELALWFRYAPHEFLRSAVHYARFSFHQGVPLFQQWRDLHPSTARILFLIGLPIALVVYLRDII